MPHSVDSLGLEVLLSLDDSLGEDLTIVDDFGVHVVDHEGLSEVVLIVGEGHRLEMQGHHGA